MTTHALNLSSVPAVPMAAVWRFASTALIAAFALLMVQPMAVVELARAGVASAAVGFFAFLVPATMVLLILALPCITRRIGHVRAVQIGLAAGLLAAAGFMLLDSYWAWCLLAVLCGVQFAVHWTSVDTVLSQNVPKARAGTLIGLYQTLLALAVAAGPAVAVWSGLGFEMIGLIAAVLMIVALLLTLGGLRRRIDAAAVPGSERHGLWAFIRRHPALLAIALVGGLFEVGTTAMSAVHALHLGFSAAMAILIVSVISGGSLLAQVPIGRLADRFGAPRLMKLSVGVLLASSLALPLAAWQPLLLWPLALLWGAFGGALQTLVYMHVAVSQRGQAVQLGMMTMALGFTVGTMIGPGLGGLVKQLWPAHGFALLLLTLSIIAAAVAWSRRAWQTEECAVQ
jgi:MFS family permease